MGTLAIILIIVGGYLTYHYLRRATDNAIIISNGEVFQNKQLGPILTGIILIILGLVFFAFNSNSTNEPTKFESSKKVTTKKQETSKKNIKKGDLSKNKFSSSSSSESKAKHDKVTPAQQPKEHTESSSSYVPKPKAPVGQWIDIQEVKNDGIPDGHVIITPNGRKYHNSAYDSSLSRTTTVMVISKESAEAQGYTLAQR